MKPFNKHKTNDLFPEEGKKKSVTSLKKCEGHKFMETPSKLNSYKVNIKCLEKSVL